MLNYKLPLYALVILFFFNTVTFCYGKTSFQAGIGKMQGHTTYSIGGFTKVKLSDDSIVSGTIHDPLSELKFSLNVSMIQFGIDHTTENNWFFSSNYATNLSKNTEKMEDRDWGIDGDSASTLSIYSESDSRLDAVVFGLEILKGIDIKRNVTFLVGGNYLYEKFEYDISNTHQYSPSGLSGYDADISGATLEYEIEYRIASLVGKLALAVESFDLMIGYQFSIAAAAEDRDNHILRSKISTSKTTGNSSAILGKASYHLTDQFAVELEYKNYFIELTGTQTQKTNGEWTAEIDNKIKSNQETLLLNFTLSF